MIKTQHFFVSFFFVFASLSVFLFSLFLPVSVFQLEMQPHTQQTIYGLHIGKEYEVHIRCRMQAFTKFGEFSDSIFIQVTEIPGNGKIMVGHGWSDQSFGWMQ